MTKTKIDACKTGARAKAAKVMSHKDVDDFLDGIVDEALSATEGNPVRQGAAVIEALSLASEEAKASSVRRALALAKQLEVRGIRETELAFAIEEGKKTGLDEATVLNRYLSSLNDKVRSNQLQARLGLLAEWDVISKKHNTDVEKWLKDIANQRLLGEEFMNLNTKGGGAQSVTTNPVAFEVAKTFFSSRTFPRAELAKAGAPVRDLESYLVRQHFSEDILRSMSPEAFAEVMLGRVNRSLTFTEDVTIGKISPEAMAIANKVGDNSPHPSGVSDARVAQYLLNHRDAVLDNFYEVVPVSTREVRFTPSGEVYKPTGVRRDRTRKLHLNTIDDHMFVIENFTGGTLVSNLLNGVDSAVREATIVNNFGVNPWNTFDALRAQAGKNATEEVKQDINHPGAGANLIGKDSFAVMDQVAGTQSRGGSITVKKVQGVVNDLTRAALLQQVVIASVPDWGTLARSISLLGGDTSKAMAAQMTSLLGNLSPEKLKAIAPAIDIQNAFNAQTFQKEFVPKGWGRAANVSARAAQLTFKYSGSNRFTRSMKQGAGLGYVALTGQQMRAGLKWDGLESFHREILATSGITDNDWNMFVRNSEQLTGGDGYHSWFDLDKILELPDSAIKETYFAKQPNISSNKLADRRRAVRESFANSIAVFANHAQPTPGTRERAVLRGGAPDGTLWGALRSMQVNLLSYPYTYMFRQLSTNHRHGGILGTSQLIASGLFWGYISMTLRNIVQGRMQDVLSDDPKVQFNLWAEAAARGGLGGMLGSILLDQARFGNSPAAMAGGAPLSIIDDTVSDIWNASLSAAGGDVEKASATAVKRIRKLLLFGNMPYTAAPVNEGMFALLNILNDGSKERTRLNFEKATGGSYFID